MATSRAEKIHQTQWCSQFYAAFELMRRGYLVSFTLGNAPETDLMVQSPKGVLFKVDVKGLSAPNFWLVQERMPKNDLYYFFIDLSVEIPRFYTATSKDVQNESERYREHKKVRGKELKRTDYGMNWGEVQKYTKWILPE